MNALIGDPRTFEKKSTMDKLSVDMMMGAAVTVIIYGTRFKVYYYKYKQLLAFNTFLHICIFLNLDGQCIQTPFDIRYDLLILLIDVQDGK